MNLVTSAFRFLITPLLLLSMSSSAFAQKPVRIVSMNLCTDQLLLLLADVEHIQSISFLALEPNSSYMAQEAINHKIPINHAIPEEIILFKPDLILSGGFQHRAEVHILQKLGYQVETFPIVSSLDDAWNNINKMARLIHEQERGQAIIASMQEKIRQLGAITPTEKVPALIYHDRGYTQGKNTLMNELIDMAGWHNVALDYNIQGYRQIGLEQILLAQPKQMIYSQYSTDSRSFAQKVFSHPLLKDLFKPKQRTKIDSRLLICGGPMNIQALEQLVKARHAL